MVVIEFPANIQDSFPDIYVHPRKGLIQSVVWYLIDSKYRKTVELRKWLKSQVSKPSKELKQLAKQLKADSEDETILNILNWTKNKKFYRSGNIFYFGDSHLWDMLEKWQTAKTTFNTKKGDCEDGAILMYVLARLTGISASRLWLCAGNVWDGRTSSTVTNGVGGHAWLAYIPQRFPLNFVFMDWCIVKQNFKVNTPTGVKTFDEIKVGDEVIGYDEKTGKIATNKVVKKGSRMAENIFTLALLVNGKKRNIRCTAEHPWYIKGKWKRTDELKKGDEIYHVSGQSKVIEVTTENYLGRGKDYVKENLQFYSDNGFKSLTLFFDKKNKMLANKREVSNFCLNGANVLSVENHACTKNKHKMAKEVCNIHCEPYNNYFVQGLLSHNCYWVNTQRVRLRNKFTLSGKNIFEYKKESGGYEQVTSNYYNLWFIFNEDGAYRKFR